MDTHFVADLPLLDSTTAGERARASLDRGAKSAGMIPHVYRAMANAPGMLDTYLLGYEQFRTESGFTPAEQEVVFLTISRENGCEYCVAAHSFIADSRSHVPVSATDAIRAGELPEEEQLAAVAQMTQHLMETNGRADATEVAQFLAAGYSQEQILQVILAIAVKTLSNYTNHLFHPPLDPLFESRAWTAASSN